MAAKSVNFFIEFEFSLFYKFEFSIFIFASSSAVKIYQVLLEFKKKMTILSMAQIVLSKNK